MFFLSISTPSVLNAEYLNLNIEFCIENQVCSTFQTYHKQTQTRVFCVFEVSNIFLICCFKEYAVTVTLTLTEAIYIKNNDQSSYKNQSNNKNI